MKKAVLFLLCAAFVMGISFPSVKARPQYKKEFDAKYANLATASAAAKCNVCHVAEKEKTERNAYGMELKKHLSKEDAKNPDKIKKALADVESAKAPGGKTFGELIKEGKLPGAE